MMFGFIVSVHCENSEQKQFYAECYECIRKIYDNKIIFINDNSTVPITVDGFENVEVIDSEYLSRGELLPYYYFYKLKFFTRQHVCSERITL